MGSSGCCNVDISKIKFMKAYHRIESINDLIKDHDNITIDKLFLIKANSLINFLNIIENSGVLKDGNNEENETLLNSNFIKNDYKPESIEIYNDYIKCKEIAINDKNGENDNKFIIVDEKVIKILNDKSDLEQSVILVKSIINEKQIIECKFNSEIDKLIIENIKTIYYKFIDNTTKINRNDIKINNE